jgi:CHASE3 domain sensor protein
MTEVDELGPDMVVFDELELEERERLTPVSHSQESPDGVLAYFAVGYVVVFVGFLSLLFLGLYWLVQNR